jgi:hypothetical protein
LVVGQIYVRYELLNILNIFFFFLVNYLLNDFKLGLLLLFGPFTPYRYRLQGPNKWEGARQAILTQNER